MNGCERCGRQDGGSMTKAVADARRRAEELAAAWDEGWDQHRDWNGAGMCVNPYRQRAAGVSPVPDTSGAAQRGGNADTVHDFTENVADASMCMCGIPATTHSDVMSLLMQRSAGATADPGWHEFRPARRMIGRRITEIDRCVAVNGCGLPRSAEIHQGGAT